MFAAFPTGMPPCSPRCTCRCWPSCFGMILRVVAIEWRGKIDDTQWRALADVGIAAGSWLPAVLWGVAFAILVRGLPVDRQRPRASVDRRCAQRLHAAGRCGDGWAVLVLRRGVRRAQDRRRRSATTRHRFAMWLSLPVTALVAAFGLWTQLAHGKGWTWLVLGGRGRRAAGGGGIGVAARHRRLGVRVYRRRRRGRGDSAVRLAVPESGALDAEPNWNLTIYNASSTPYTLKIMTWVTAILRPADRGVPRLDVLGVPATDLV